MIRIAGPTLPYDPTYHLLGRLDKIRAIVKAERPDVLEAHSPYLAAAACVASRGLARVQTAFWHADHVGTFVDPFLEKHLGPRFAAAVSAPLWQGVRALLAPFQATFVAGRVQADRLRAAGVPDVILAPFGVDTAAFNPAARNPARRLELLAQGGGSPNASLLVGVGRFAIEKRWDVVLEAFARVRTRRDAVLVLYGDGPERARLQRAAPAGVHFPGFDPVRRHLAEALASADLLVHGCPYETFGLGVAEAVACALPVVIPDEGGARESAAPASSAIYRSLDAGECAAAIERLLGREPSELRARALEAAAQVPTIEQHFATVLGTYDALLRARTTTVPR